MAGTTAMSNGTDSSPLMYRSSDNPYCTTEDIIRLRNSGHVKEGIKHLKEKYDSVAKFGPNGPLASPPLSPTGENPKVDKGMIVRLSQSEPNSPTNAASSKRASFTDGITEQDLQQVDMFFRSHKTEVNVCRSLANLYFGKVMGGKDHWKFTMTGLPVLVLDTGDHHRKRRLQIILAEKGTGFVLWKNNIDHLTDYTAPHLNFHTLHLSTDHTQLAGLSFDDTAAASEFYNTLSNLISDPEDELLNLSKSKKKKKLKEKSEKKKQKFKAPRKTEISQPCCFLHVTKLETNAQSVSGISGPMGFEHTTKRPETKKEESEISSQFGSKLTLASESTSSGISEDIRSYD